MKKVNIVIVYHHDGKRLLMCKRAKDPFRGMINFVGGKVEPGENLETLKEITFLEKRSRIAQR